MLYKLNTKLPLRQLSLQFAKTSRPIYLFHGRRFTSSPYWGTTNTTEQADGFIPTTDPEVKENQGQAPEKQVIRDSRLNGGSANLSSQEVPAKFLTVHIDYHPYDFDFMFLRDSCACSQCRDPHSKQKLFQTSDIPENLRGCAKLIDDKEDGLSFEIKWENDLIGYGPDHSTKISLDWLRRAINTEKKVSQRENCDDKILWDKKKITMNNKWLDFNEYMADDKTLLEALTHLNQYGLLFINNIPDSEESVVEIASRIGNLKDTFYGCTWDVRSKPEAENIAYTPHFLGLHMDLLYTSNPPHLQLLHSLRARTPGGESFFCDSFSAVHQLNRQSPNHLFALRNFPVVFEYHHPTQHYHARRLTIEPNPTVKPGRIKKPHSFSVRRVNWSPPFQGPFESRITTNTEPSLRSFIAASHAFEKILSAEENLYEYRLNEGECVIFDNRRVLHARKAFDATKGERWLKGAYIDDDVFFSKLRVLEEKFNGHWTADGVVRHSLQKNTMEDQNDMSVD